MIDMSTGKVAKHWLQSVYRDVKTKHQLMVYCFSFSIPKHWTITKGDLKFQPVCIFSLPARSLVCVKSLMLQKSIIISLLRWPQINVTVTSARYRNIIILLPYPKNLTVTSAPAITDARRGEEKTVDRQRSRVIAEEEERWEFWFRCG